MKIEILNLFKQLDSCNKTLLVIVLYITAIFYKNLAHMAINNVSDYFRSKLSHIWARFDLPGPSIYRASTLSPERPGK